MQSQTAFYGLRSKLFHFWEDRKLIFLYNLASFWLSVDFSVETFAVRTRKYFRFRFSSLRQTW